MTSDANSRKAAVAISLLPAMQRKGLLATMSPATRGRLELLISELGSRRWNRPEALRRALGEPSAHEAAQEALSAGELLSLSKVLSPEVFSRVLLACHPADAYAQLSGLDGRYSDQVRQALKQARTVSPKLARSLQARARILLERGAG